MGSVEGQCYLGEGDGMVGFASNLLADSSRG
jgi:hypothetical protein